MNNFGSHKILASVIHQIDINEEQATPLEHSLDEGDFNTYLVELINEVQNSNRNRSYAFESESTEFYVAMKSFFKSKTLNDNKANSLAKRLLSKETETNNRYAHLSQNRNNLLNKGSFLQFLFDTDSKVSYLGVKVDHQTFIDEEDLQKKIGLAIENKIYKACLVEFINSEIRDTVLIYDTNSKPAVYWCNSFLELKEFRTNSYNTETASTAVIRKINSLQKDYPKDHTVLRNATVAAFKQNNTMNYSDFVRANFENYEPIHPELKKNLPKFTKELLELPAKKNFDNTFELSPKDVPFKRKKIELSKEITLSIEEGISDLKSKIWAEKTEDGKELVVIHSPEGYKLFSEKEN